jgi:ATP-binding cassette subfamily B protein
MNRILVLHHGKIVEDATHAELIVKNGLYKTLWGEQTGGFIAVKENEE